MKDGNIETVRGRASRPREIESACRFIEALVASVFSVSAAELRSASRGRAPVAFARQAAMYLAHVQLGLSPAAVGIHFARNRTTVAHACARIEDCRDRPGWMRLFECLEAAVETWAKQFPPEGRAP